MKIAIVKLSAIGDIIYAMSLLQFIKRHIKEVSIDWVVDEKFKELIKAHPDLNKVYTINLKESIIKKSYFLFFQELMKMRQLDKYDLVIDMQGLIKSALVAKIIPSDKTIGFDKHSSREALAAIFYNQKYKIDYSDNIVSRNIALINNSLNLSIDSNDIFAKKPYLFSSKPYEFNVMSSTKKNIALIPGASFSSKSYPIEKFAEFTKKIDANFIVIWGNEKEKALAYQIKALSSKVNIIRELSLDSLISLIAQLDLVIGSDTGPTHFAWALNKPSITLFGPTPGYRNTFVTKYNKVIESDSKINPYKIDKNDLSIRNIKVNDIVKMAEYLLKLKV